MKEFTQSLCSYSLAMALFGLKEIDNMLNSRPRSEAKAPAVKALDSLTCATTAQFGETLADTYQAADRVQRALLGFVFDVVFPLVASEIRRQVRGNPEVILVATPVEMPQAPAPLMISEHVESM